VRHDAVGCEDVIFEILRRAASHKSQAASLAFQTTKTRPNTRYSGFSSTKKRIFPVFGGM
ncbi:MAG TPA: hypothetical protein PLI34_17200, partial [Saprospiraceae bacterium]|nr:hypothetical protein [Saprospiraceae bacterium]